MGFALQTDHVPKRHGQTVAVDDLSFRVGPGRITGLSRSQRLRQVDDDEDPLAGGVLGLIGAWGLIPPLWARAPCSSAT